MRGFLLDSPKKETPKPAYFCPWFLLTNLTWSDPSKSAIASSEEAQVPTYGFTGRHP